MDSAGMRSSSRVRVLTALRRDEPLEWRCQPRRICKLRTPCSGASSRSRTGAYAAEASLSADTQETGCPAPCSDDQLDHKAADEAKVSNHDRLAVDNSAT